MKKLISWIVKQAKKGGLFYFFRLVYNFNSWLQKRFTTGGLFVMGGLLASAVVGIDTKQTVAYKVFTFLLSLISIAVVLSFFFRPRFAVKRILPKFATKGEMLSYRIIIENKSLKKQSGLFFYEDIKEPSLSHKEFLDAQEPGEENRNFFDRTMGYHRFRWLILKKKKAQITEQSLPLLPPSMQKEIKAEIIPQQRGYLNFNRLIISSPDPFGLFKAFVHIYLEQTVLVLPRRYHLPPLSLPGTRIYQSGGVALASLVGDSEEFISLRDYRPGDPLRKIDWKSWAKTGKPIVREYQDEFFVRHALVLDTFIKEDHDEIFEEAVSIAASFVSSMETRESLVDLMFVGEDAHFFTSGRGLCHTDKMLEILAIVTTCKEKPFSLLYSLILNHASALSVCICIFLSWDDERKKLISHLKELGISLLVIVVTSVKPLNHPDTEFDLGPMKETPENFYMVEAGKIQEGLRGL